MVPRNLIIMNVVALLALMALIVVEGQHEESREVTAGDCFIDASRGTHVIKILEIGVFSYKYETEDLHLGVIIKSEFNSTNFIETDCFDLF